MGGFDIWQFIGGVAVFVFAMNLIEDSLKNIAGRSFKIFLQRQSQSKIKMVAASTVSTAFLQSSSVVLTMVISFVGAGLMNMRGALAAVLGANLGTTLDSWVIAIFGFKINFYQFSFPLLGVALIGLLFFKKKSKLAYATTFIIGFAFIFIALEWLKNCFDPSVASQLGDLKQLPYLLFIPIGFLLTSIIQSSSVTIAITLSVLFNQLITFESAAAMVIGSELGTTLKFLVGSIGGITDKKRVAWGNFMINFMTMVIAAIFLLPLVHFIREMVGITNPLIALVIFQTSINFLSLLFFYPLMNVFAQLLERAIKDKTEKTITQYIHKSLVTTPGDALEITKKEIRHLLNECIELNKMSFGLTKQNSEWFFSRFRNLTSDALDYTESYDKIKQLQGEILDYISGFAKEEMTAAEVEKTGKYINIIRHLLRSVKNLKDIRHNLDEFEASVNDKLFALQQQIKKMASSFYEAFQHLLNEPSFKFPERLQELIEHNRIQYDKEIAALLTLLKEDAIRELDSANLINVYREIYSSNEALIQALGDLNDLDNETED